MYRVTLLSVEHSRATESLANELIGTPRRARVSSCGNETLSFGGGNGFVNPGFSERSKTLNVCDATASAPQLIAVTPADRILKIVVLCGMLVTNSGPKSRAVVEVVVVVEACVVVL